MVQSGPTGGGTSLNQNMKVPNSNQQNNYGVHDRLAARGTSRWA